MVRPLQDALRPIIEKAVRAAKGAVRLVKMNIDEHPAIAGQLGIQSIPAVIAFANGQPVDGFVGALPESQVKAFIDRVAGPAGPSDAEALVAEGEALLRGRRRRRRRRALCRRAQGRARSRSPRSPGSPRRCSPAAISIAPARRWRCCPSPPTATRAWRPCAPRSTSPAQTAALGDTASLEARIAADPDDMQARFDLALLLNAKGDRDGAVDHLLEIVRKDRSWEDEKARKQLVQFFEAWGPMDEATRAGRRQLSSLLFA